MKKQNNPSIAPYDIKCIVRAILDENGNSIGQDEFPIDKDKFFDLYMEAVRGEMVYKLYAFKHEGKTIVFTWEFV